MPRPFPAMSERDARDLLEGYLGEIVRLLAWADRRSIADVVDELRDGLIEATDVETSRGAPPDAAAQEAIRRFGSPQLVADTYSSELAIRYSRRNARAVLGCFLLGCLLWFLGYELALGVPHAAIPPPSWTRDLFLSATTAIQYLPPLGAVGAIVHLIASKRLDPGDRISGGVSRAGARLSVTALLAQLIVMAAILTTGGPALWTPGRTAVTVLLVIAQTCALAMSIKVATHLRLATHRISCAYEAGSDVTR